MSSPHFKFGHSLQMDSPNEKDMHTDPAKDVKVNPPDDQMEGSADILLADGLSEMELQEGANERSNTSIAEETSEETSNSSQDGQAPPSELANQVELTEHFDYDRAFFRTRDGAVLFRRVETTLLEPALMRPEEIELEEIPDFYYDDSFEESLERRPGAMVYTESESD